MGKDIQKCLLERFHELGYKYETLSNETGVNISILNRFLTGRQRGIFIKNFVSICKVLRFDIENFFESGGKPVQIIDGTDLRIAAWQYIEEETDPQELLKLKKELNSKLSWADLADTWEVRERALDPDSDTSYALRLLAENEPLWLAARPTPEEVETIETKSFRRHGPRKTAEEYIISLQRLREQKKKKP